ELVPGGVVRPPGSMRSAIDLRFGDGHVPACLAETMILAATREYDRRSLGGTTRSSDIEFYLREGERLGFRIVTSDPHVSRPEARATGRGRAAPPTERRGSGCKGRRASPLGPRDTGIWAASALTRCARRPAGPSF